jgi:hypothetical protein
MSARGGSFQKAGCQSGGGQISQSCSLVTGRLNLERKQEMQGSLRLTANCQIDEQTGVQDAEASSTDIH